MDIEDLDQVRCLGAPFFPKGERQHCVCNEMIKDNSNKCNALETQKKEIIDLNYDMDDTLGCPMDVNPIEHEDKQSSSK